MSQINDNFVTTNGTICPPQDGQGCWYEFLSPTQVFIEQEAEQQQSNENYIQQRKKRSQGNRREQHRRRRQRRRQEKLNKAIHDSTDYINRPLLIVTDNDNFLFRTK